MIVIVNRGKRENAFDYFGREIIFVHNTDFRDVVINIKSEKDFLLCFSRICSCNLMLLKYFSKQRLQTNVFVFFLLYALLRLNEFFQFVFVLFVVVVVIDVLQRLNEFFRFILLQIRICSKNQCKSVVLKQNKNIRL